MKTTANKIRFVIIASILLTACKKEIVFTGDSVDPLIVVNSFVSTDSILSVHLSKSRFFLSNQNAFETIDEADVSVFVNREFKEKLVYTEHGMYRGTYQPITGDTLNLQVRAEGFNEVESNTVILPPSNILQIDTTLTVNDKYPIFVDGDEIGGYQYYVDCDIKINMQDERNETNYYRVTLTKYEKIYVEDEDTLYVTKDPLPFVLEGLDNQTNNIIDFIEGGENYGIQQLIADDFFDGKEVRFKLKTHLNYVEIVPGFEEYFNSGYYPQRADTQFLIINVQALTKSTYLYLQSKQKAQDVLNGIFTEPVQIYNNITNGIGIFGSYTNNRQYIKIQ